MPCGRSRATSRARHRTSRSVSPRSRSWGGCSSRTYAASPESYAAARLLAASTTADPVRALWWRWSGRLARSRQLLWGLAENDPQCIHATTLAVHGIVDALDRMRTILLKDARRRDVLAPDHAAVRQPRGPPDPTAVVLAPDAGAVPEGPACSRDPRCLPPAKDARGHRRRWAGPCPRPLEPVPRALDRSPGSWEKSGRPLVASGPSSATASTSRPSSTDCPDTRSGRSTAWSPGTGCRQCLASPTWRCLRVVLREQNLHDPPSPTAPSTGCPMAWTPGVRSARTADGTYNDLADPAMGSAGTCFGRNVPLAFARVEPEPALLQPNPRLISRRLMTRDEFIPARTLNVLAAAWIQFQVHDWFNHKTSAQERPFELEIEADDKWPASGPCGSTARSATTRRAGRTPPPRSRTPRPTGGMPPSSTAARPSSSVVSAPDRTASCAIRSDGRLPFDPADRPRGRRGQQQLVGRPQPHAHAVHASSTTPSATACAPSIPGGTTSSSSPRRASSTRRSSPRSTPWSGRPPSWAIRP